MFLCEWNNCGSIPYMAYLKSGLILGGWVAYIRCGGAYIRNDVNVNNLMGLYSGGLIIGGLRYLIITQAGARLMMMVMITVFNRHANIVG